MQVSRVITAIHQSRATTLKTGYCKQAFFLIILEPNRLKQKCDSSTQCLDATCLIPPRAVGNKHSFLSAFSSLWSWFSFPSTPFVQVSLCVCDRSRMRLANSVEARSGFKVMCRWFRYGYRAGSFKQFTSIVVVLIRFFRTGGN